MLQSIMARILRKRRLTVFLTNAYLRINRWAWKYLPPSIINLLPIRSYGNFLHTLVRLSSNRRQNSSTFFFRNRPELELVRHLSDRKPRGSTLKLLVLACSNGAEVYSILFTIRSARPDLRVMTHAVDISKEVLKLGERGTYPLGNHDLINVPIFERVTEEEKRAMFDTQGDQVKINSWLKEGIIWHVGDAGDPELPNLLGHHDMVFANRFLCHMDPPDAEGCLRNIAQFVDPEGYLFVSGIDLDVRTRVARDLGWKPLRRLSEYIYEGDPSLRDSWPWGYWTQEPVNTRRPDWHLRYTSVFQIPVKILSLLCVALNDTLVTLTDLFARSVRIMTS